MGKAHDRSGGVARHRSSGTPIPRQAEAAMLQANIPYAAEQALWFIGACVLIGAGIGIIRTLARG